MNRSGIIFALCAYSWWGFAPIFWKFLKHVPAVETLGHRMVWALAVLIIYQTVRKNWGWLHDALRDPRLLFVTAIAAVMLALNAWLYTWGVNNDKIVDVSLGYFMNPLFLVLSGFFFYKEEIRPLQWAAIAVAALGVLYLTFVYGQFPLVGLSLAGAFTLYSVAKKQTTLGTFEGMTLEMGIMFPIFLVYLLTLEQGGGGHFTSAGWLTTVLLIIGGAVSLTPFLLFSAAAGRIPLFYLGVMQYIGPSISFLIGIFVYGETVSNSLLIGFCFVWTALIIFSVEGWIQVNRKRARAIVASG
jgi:chloramphenicol-sensitive protein RarD